MGSPCRTQLGTGSLGHNRPNPLGRSRGVPAGTKFQIISFYIDESVPFGESCRFAYTEAPVLRALGPSSFQQQRIGKRLTCMGGIFFLTMLLALVPSWPQLGFEGLALRGPMPECCRFA